MHRVVQTYQRRLSSSDHLEVPSTLAALLFFHRHSFVESTRRQKIMRAMRNATAQTRTTIRIINQLIVKVFSALLSVARLSRLSEVLSLYIIFELDFVWCTVLSLHVDGFSTHAEQFTGRCYWSSGWFERRKSRSVLQKSGQYNAFCTIMYTLIYILQYEIGNNALYDLGTNWRDLNKFEVPENDDSLPMVFVTLSNIIIRELGIEGRKAPTPELINIQNPRCRQN